jgi:hypothetical protein
MPSQIPPLTIQVQPNGGVSVSGPIQDKLLCYGMLECARDAIREHAEKAANGKIIAASPAQAAALVSK